MEEQTQLKPTSDQQAPTSPIPVKQSNKLLIVTAALIFILMAGGLVYLGYQNYQLQQKLDQLSREKTNQVAVEDSNPAPVTTLALEPSKDITLPHEYLPGFDITYSEGWVLGIKQFRDKDPGDFISTYFPTCHERCMGIRLSRSNVSLDLLFDVAFDSNAFKCSNSVTYEQITNGWYRVKDGGGYFYTKNVELNKTLVSGKFPSPFGKSDDEWSAVAGTNYKICVQGSGNFLSQFSKVESGETGKGVPILMEFPKIKGNPDGEMLLVLDNIVASIKGIK